MLLNAKWHLLQPELYLWLLWKVVLEPALFQESAPKGFWIVAEYGVQFDAPELSLGINPEQIKTKIPTSL